MENVKWIKGNPLNVDDIKELKPGDWVWVVTTFGGSNVYRQISPNTTEDVIEFFNIHYVGTPKELRWNYLTLRDYGTRWVAYKNKEQAEEEPSKVKSINAWVSEVHSNSRLKGWYDKPIEPAELLCLIHSEVSEVLEEIRKGYPLHKIYRRIPDDKPEGVPVELADVVLRVMDMAGYYGINLEKAMEEKHKYNQSRPYRHGGKSL